jgi:galactose mutarotase-like enzyme
VGAGVADGSGRGLDDGVIAGLAAGKPALDAGAQAVMMQAAKPAATSLNCCLISFPSSWSLHLEPTTGHDLTLRADPWELTLRPERGGRIVSVRLNGAELLDQGIGVDRPDAAGFVEGGAWGWDEMVPNLEATERLPDHGEAWRTPWTVVESSTVSALLRATGRLVAWELVRQIELTPASIRAGYVYTNRGDLPLAAYWCSHPLFRYEPGMEVAVPDGGRFSHLAEGTSLKVHLAKGALSQVWVRWPSGPAIAMRWDAEKTPYVAIWACNGALGGYRQLAIEPATGGGDGLDPSASAPMLEPGSQLKWWLEIRQV